MSAVLTGAGRALPTTIEQDAVWEGFFAGHYADVRAARRVFASAGVRRRHAVANPLDEDISGWSTGARMQRYVQEALPLGKQAVAAALDDAGLAPGDVGLFAVATCTGYATPAWTSGWPATSACRRGCSGCWSATWAATPPSPASPRSVTTWRPGPARPCCCAAS
jgi:Predicted naringenin-chalcone synthase